MSRSGIPFVDFGGFNHNNGSERRNDPAYDALIWKLKQGILRTVWRFLKFCARKWYWTVPLVGMQVGQSFNSVGFMFFVLLVVTPICMLYRFKWRKPKVVKILSDEDLLVAEYVGVWPEVARNAGLEQKATPQGMGLYNAYRRMVNEQSADRKLNELAYGIEDDSVVPELLNIESAPLGMQHTVKLLPGQTVDTFSKAADVLAALWMVSSVRVAPGVPGQVLLTPVVNDPMADIDAITHDNYRKFDASVHAVRVGALEDGSDWVFPLGVHSIVAGNSGGGKSVCYRALISQMATVPEVQLILIDLKRGIEAKPFKPRLSATAKDMDGALDALKEVWGLAEQRLDFLEERGLTDMRDYGFSPEMPRIIVMIDECSELFAVGEPDRELAKQGKEAIALVSKMLRLVRAAGITIIMATQRPSTEVVPSGIRELTQNRVAFRMMNSSGAIMALGEMPDNSISPVDIPESKKGRAVVTDDQGNYSFAQCRFISPDTAKAVAAENALLAVPLSALKLTRGVMEEPGYYNHEGVII